MHFFIDHLSLTTQASGNGFGVVSGTNFRLTSSFSLSTEAKAFAPMRSLMIVQPSNVDSTLVNIILKPLTGLSIEAPKVQYIILRGLLKSKFMTGSSGSEVLVSSASATTEFMQRLWTEFNDFKDTSSLPNPGIDSIGYDDGSTFGNLDIAQPFSGSESAKPVMVKEGEWIGDFSNSFDIGIDVVLDGRRSGLKMNDIRAEKIELDVSSLTGLEERIEREKILNFLDPAALWGMHYNAGVNVSTYSGGSKTTTSKDSDPLYNDLVSKFEFPNRLYLDIRSEKGYSYNFYQDYDDGTTNNHNVSVGQSSGTTTNQKYESQGWPLLTFDSAQSTTNSKNKLFLKLRVDGNVEPLLYFGNKDLTKDESRNVLFDSNELLNGSSTDWTNEVFFQYPNTGTGSTRDNVCHWIRATYFWKSYPSEYPNYHDNAFGTLNMDDLGNTSSLHQKSAAEYPTMANGQGKFIVDAEQVTRSFAQIMDSGAFFDDSLTTLYARAKHSITTSDVTLDDYSTGVDGIPIEGNGKSSFLTVESSVSHFIIDELVSGSTYQRIPIPSMYGLSKKPNFDESLMTFGLSNSEVSSLKTSASGLHSKHDTYFRLEPTSATMPLTDKHGEEYYKYELKVTGIDSSTGQRSSLSASPPVYAYSRDNFSFSTAAYASAQATTINANKTGKRSYEERLGIFKGTEDNYINYDSKTKSIVNSFIKELSNIESTDDDAKEKIKTLVKNKGEELFNQGVNYIQNTSYFDDRPLYWGRIKMSAHIKMHPLLKGDVDENGEAKAKSTLKEILEQFERNSRNRSYLNIKWPDPLPSGTKKILLTGFDPYTIYWNGDATLGTQNPSGIAALFLHGKTISDGAGNKAFIQSAIFPVRYRDFDQGVVEHLMQTMVYTPWGADMIMTISLNGGSHYSDIERVAAKYRGGYVDNNNQITGDSDWANKMTNAHNSLLNQFRNNGQKTLEELMNYLPPLHPNRVGQLKTKTGKPFYETTLPVSNIITSASTNGFNLDKQVLFYDQSYGAHYDAKQTNKTLLVAEAINDGPNKATNDYTSPDSYQYMIGSGGDYLSNEIFYRVSKIRDTFTSPKTGHLHVANIESDPTQERNGQKPVRSTFDTKYLLDSNKKVALQAEQIIKNALSGI